MQIPNISELATYRQQGEVDRKRARELKNAEAKRQATLESNTMFTEAYVAEKIIEMMKTPGGNTVTFRRFKYMVETDNGSQEEYVPFPADIIKKLEAAGLRCSNRYCNEFGVFFTAEAENKWYR